MTDSTQASAPEATNSAATDVQSGAPAAAPVTEQAPAAPEAQAEAPAEAPGQPYEWQDFTVPEGVQLNEEITTSFKSILEDAKLSPQEKAQSLLDLQGKLTQSLMESQEQAQAAQKQQWADQIKADPELGGANFDKTVETAVKAIEQFGSPELRTLLNGTGIGNHPELVKFCHRIGKALSEDSLVMGGDKKPDTRTADVLFGDIKLS